MGPACIRAHTSRKESDHVDNQRQLSDAIDG